MGSGYRLSEQPSLHGKVNKHHKAAAIHINTEPFGLILSGTEHLKCSCLCIAEDKFKSVISSYCKKGGRAGKMLQHHLLGEHSRNPSGPIP